MPAVVEWINTDPAGGRWFDARNWQDGRVPTRDDEVRILRPGAVVLFDPGRVQTATVLSILCSQKLVIRRGVLETREASSIKDLELAGGKLDAAESLELTGDVLWTGGVLSGDSSIDFRGRTVAKGSGAKELDAGTVNNYGFWALREGRIDSRDGAVFFNRPGGVVRFEGGTEFDLVSRNHGLWVVEAAGTIDVPAFTNLGFLTLASGRLLADSFDQYSGMLLLTGGILASGRPVTLNGGSLLGGGTVEGSLFNKAASVAPGGTPLVIEGDYTQGPRGRLEVTLSGPAERGDFDTVVVGGTATLGGFLVGRVLPPRLGTNNRYEILTADAVVGRFANGQPVSVPGFTLVQRVEGASFALLAAVRPVAPPPPVDDDDPPLTDDLTTDATAIDFLDLAGRLAGTLPSAILGSDPSRSLGRSGAVFGGGLRPLDPYMSGGGAGVAGPGRAVASVVDRSSSGRSESGGSAEVTPAPEPIALALPDLEPPPQEEALAARDFAKEMLLGGRARSALLPQGGSQGAVIATRLAGDEGQAEAPRATRSRFAHLFINPVPKRAPEEPPAAEEEDDDPPQEADDQQEALWRPDGGALTLAVFSGMVAWLAERRQRKLCSGPGNVPSLTSRQ